MYIYIYTSHNNIYIYIYIYRERERDGSRASGRPMAGPALLGRVPCARDLPRFKL